PLGADRDKRAPEEHAEQNHAAQPAAPREPPSHDARAEGPTTSAKSEMRRSRPPRLIRSPSVERFTPSSAAAVDLFPRLAASARSMRLASSSRNRSSSEVGAAQRITPVR